MESKIIRIRVSKGGSTGKPNEVGGKCSPRQQCGQRGVLHEAKNLSSLVDHCPPLGPLRVKPPFQFFLPRNPRLEIEISGFGFSMVFSHLYMYHIAQTQNPEPQTLKTGYKTLGTKHKTLNCTISPQPKVPTLRSRRSKLDTRHPITSPGFSLNSPNPQEDCDCSGHGECVLGACSCNPDWVGSTCSHHTLSMTRFTPEVHPLERRDRCHQAAFWGRGSSEVDSRLDELQVRFDQRFDRRWRGEESDVNRVQGPY